MSLSRRIGSRPAFLALLVVLSGCGTTAQPPSPAATVLRLGYFPNVTHATALVGDRGDLFAAALGQDVELEIQNFNAGNEAVEALFNGGIDMTYIGPNPAINAFTRSNGEAVRIIAGATSGGAFLVVADGIDSAGDLRGATVASPALGNTQDVALRSWLADNGMTTDAEGGGDVSVTPLSNADILEAFAAGSIAGAWVPEPWATRLRGAGGHALVDERDLWPDGRYVTTHVLVATSFLREHPEVVKRFLAGHLAATELLNSETARAQTLVAEGITAITGAAISPDVLAAAWTNLTFTVDPIAASLRISAEQAYALGFLPESPDLEGIYDLALLNEVLREAGREEIAQP